MVSDMDTKKALKMLIRWKVPIAKGLVALVAALTVALMLACGDGASTSDSGNATASNMDASSASGGLETDFSFTLYQGEDVLGASTVQLSDLLDKPTVLNFWAGLCPPCREEMPHFQEFYDDFEERINFVGVDVGQFTGLGNPEDAQELLERPRSDLPRRVHPRIRMRSKSMSRACLPPFSSHRQARSSAVGQAT